MGRYAWVGGALFVLSLASCSDSEAGGAADAGDDAAATVLPPAAGMQSCSTSLDCRGAPGDAAICDPSTGTCVQCVSSEDCDADHECVAAACVAVMRCDDSLDCSLGLVCDPATSRCVECAAAADCDAGEVCAGSLCRPECASDRACTPLGLLCNRELGHCVACFGDADCGSGSRCEAGACVATQSVTPSGCMSDEKRCDGACVAVSPEVGCGAMACAACPEVTNGVPACAGASCDVVCDAGYVKNGTSCLLPIPACVDGAQSDGETDVDCGGSQCPKCDNGKACLGDEDCAAGSCVDDRCQSSACTNGAFDPGETDVDCGGVDCPPCETGAVCEDDPDCSSRVCAASTGRCSEPTCTDRTPNGDEVGTDCGGPTCPKCADGVTCKGAEDCTSGVCETVCRPAHCANDAMDMGETDIDCGGTPPLGTACSRCGTSGMCMTSNDCQSSICEGMQCQAPSCTDGIGNGTETGNDCGGGECPQCGPYGSCRSMADCGVGECVAGECRESCDGSPAGCSPCMVPTFTPCCRADDHCGCGIAGACIL